jgi:PAS domain S-box-containing protein
MNADHPEFKGDEKAGGFFVVGIGASAGGIQALREFFQHLPADTNMAYVVILHLSPDHDSKLAEILSTVSTIPVIQVKEKTRIEPNIIFVVPPNKHLVISEGYIAPIDNLHIEDRRAPVDIFFRNLADNYGPRAISVVLSGTGANGSMGLKRIKERGGVTYVQSPLEAEFNEMPRNAIATELVDEILPVSEIPSRILAYRDNQGIVSIIEESDLRPEQQKQALREIFAQLRSRTGNDFSNYKRATLLRRIERRINIRNLADLPSYVSYLQQNPDESQALLKDLLISVTNFFRDNKTFEALEREVIPQIFKNKTSADEVRIWIAGCATGEEAYSIAMLCSEKVLEMTDPPKVQIFATDIDEAAIATAREGLYTLNDVADVSPDRLGIFFTCDGEYFRIRKEIREMIIFATHNFLKDPPFSRLDLISCRNVMIYLNNTAQERVAETFHFASKPKGFLFLGTSETVEGANDLFSPFDRGNHIYQAREITVRNYPVPSSVPNFQFSKNDPLQKSDEKDVRPIRTSFGELHQRLLEQYAPPSIVVNEEYEIVHLSDKAGKFLELKGGEPTQNLLKLIRPELRLELRSSFYQAVQNKIAVKSNKVSLFLDGQKISVEVQARPVFEDSSAAKGFILVLFIQHSIEKENAAPVSSISDEPVAKQLEEELVLMKSRLKNSIEQHEVQAEELKASNEELQAMNEELRSAAEELETSKEELQSINEELRTVNQELKIKIEETSLTSNNLQNLINSTNLGTIFLDRSLSIRLFTPAVLDLFNLKPGDFGRPVSDITHKLKYDNLLTDAEAVLANLVTVEREVTSTDGRHFLMRLLPYRTTEDRINGVVITLIDITKRKKSEYALQESEEYLRLIIESAKDYAIFTIDTERKIVRWSTGAQAMMGFTEEEIRGRSGDITFVPEDRENAAPLMEVLKAEKEGRAENERWHLRKDGTRFWGSGSVSPLKDNNGKLMGFVKIMRDLTEVKEAEERYRSRMEKEVILRTAELEEINNNLRHANENLQQFASIASHDLQEPLRKINIFTSILNKKWSHLVPDEGRKIIQKITYASDRMGQLIQEVLEYSRIVHGAKEFEQIDLGKTLQNVLIDLDLLTEETGAKIHFPEKMPTIDAISLQLHQLFYNLINNALKFRKGNIAPEIKISLQPLKNSEIKKLKNLKDGKSYVEIIVADNGIGFDPQFSEQIFQIFERLHTSDEYEGTGVGLALCKKIAENHHGHIYAIANIGEGSSFHIVLPVQQ